MKTLEKTYPLPDTSRLTFFEKGHYYELDGKKLTGVTSVIEGTSSKQNLVGWAARMACEHIEKNAELCTGSDEDHRLYHVTSDLLDAAKSAHARRRDRSAEKGTDVHALVETFINECIENKAGIPFIDHRTSTPNEVYPFIEWAVANVDRFLAAEQRLYSENHALAGTADFIAIVNGKLTIGDVKTFPKMWSADPFIQCGAYAMMFGELTGEYPEQSMVVKLCDPNDERIRKYGGRPFAVYPRYALTEDADIFLKRLEIYRYNQNFTSPKE